MLNLLQSLRYFIFGVFVICSAIIASVAVWNLSIVQSVADFTTAKQVDAYLIFVGASGLLLIFPIIFCELATKYSFLLRVWFELLWVGSFWVMHLIGAAVITALSNSQLCDSIPIAGTSKFPSATSPQESPCASSQVLQAFTWICSILLLGYFVFLSVLTIAKYKDDPTILHCRVHRFPLAYDRGALKSFSAPVSPTMSHFRAPSPPVIAAPRPQRIAPLREAFMAHRSDLSHDYEIEHFQGGPTRPPEPTTFGSRFARPSSDDAHRASSLEGHVYAINLPQTAATAAPPPMLLQPVRKTAAQTQPATYSIPFYHSSVTTAIQRTTGPQVPPPAHVGGSSLPQAPPSPPPLGDWPRMDATTRPRTKRKPLPRPQVDAEPQPPPAPQPQPPSRMNSQTEGHVRPLPLVRGMSQSRALPPKPTAPHEQYTFDAPALAAALQPLAAQPSAWRSKPTGPRRRSDSIDDGRPVSS